MLATSATGEPGKDTGSVPARCALCGTVHSKWLIPLLKLVALWYQALNEIPAFRYKQTPFGLPAPQGAVSIVIYAIRNPDGTRGYLTLWKMSSGQLALPAIPRFHWPWPIRFPSLFIVEDIGNFGHMGRGTFFRELPLKSPDGWKNYACRPSDGAPLFAGERPETAPLPHEAVSPTPKKEG